LEKAQTMNLKESNKQTDEIGERKEKIEVGS